MTTRLALVIVALASAPLAQGGWVQQEGAFAPVNRWYTQGGCASRSGVALTEPVRGPVEVAWEQSFEGTLEGEPLVWDDKILVTLQAGGSKRIVRVLDLLTGEPALPDRVVHSLLPLEPSMWGKLLVVRSAEDQLLGLRIGSKRLYGDWTYRAPGPVSAPLLVGNEVYVTAGDGLERLTVGKREPVWRAEGGYRGRPSLLGDHIYAAIYTETGPAYVARHQREGGEGVAPMFAGDHGLWKPAPQEDARLAILGSGIFVRHSKPVRLNEGTSRYVGLGAEGWGREEIRILGASTRLVADPVAWKSGWLGRIDDPELGHALIQVDYSAESSLGLASPKHNPDFSDVEVPASIAFDVAYVGGRAFDVETQRVLWRLPLEPTARAVPARETVLLRVGDSKLVALRRAERERAQALTTATEGDVGEGLVVLRDGSIETGRLLFDLDGGTIRLDEERDSQSWRLSDALLVEDAAGTLLYAAGREELLLALDTLTTLLMADGYADLADRARHTNDLILMERLLGRAWILGAEGKELERVEQAIASLEERPKGISTKKVQDVIARELELAALPARMRWERYRALPDDAPLSWRATLLREVLHEDPEHSEARFEVRKMLPPEVVPRGTFDALDWLAFVEAIDATPVRIVLPAAVEREGLSYSRRKLGQYQASWRPDLIGFESEHLLVITPLNRPGAIAGCLSQGELVCQTLREIFAGAGRDRGGRDPMVLLLFESKEEYLRHSGGRGGEAGSGLAWSGGHYDEGENVSRIFVPPGDEGFDSVMETYAHELTHHWLRMRCPRFPFKELEDADLELPGFWIVEGFAGMVEEFAFDPGSREWWSDGVYSRRMDVVANASPHQHVAWDKLYSLSRTGFWSVSAENIASIPSTCFLGRLYQVSALNMFYDQAAATCHYLFHAERGRYRRFLLDYVAAYYTGNERDADVQRVFGLSPEELGQRVLAHAKSRVEAVNR